MTSLEKYEELKVAIENEKIFFGRREYLNAALQVRVFTEMVLHLYSEKVDFDKEASAGDKINALKEITPKTFVEAMFRLKGIGNSGAHVDKGALSEYVKRHLLCEQAMGVVIKQVEKDFFKQSLEARAALDKFLSDSGLSGIMIHEKEIVIEESEAYSKLRLNGYFEHGFFTYENTFAIGFSYGYLKKKIDSIEITYNDSLLFSYNGGFATGLWTEKTESQKILSDFVREQEGQTELSSEYYYAKMMGPDSSLKGVLLSVLFLSEHGMPFFYNDGFWKFEGDCIVREEALTEKYIDIKRRKESADKRKNELLENIDTLYLFAQIFYELCGSTKFLAPYKFIFRKDINDFVVAIELLHVASNCRLYAGMGIADGDTVIYLFDSNMKELYSCKPIVDEKHAICTYRDGYEKIYPIIDFYSAFVSLMNKGVLLQEVALVNSKDTVMIDSIIARQNEDYREETRLAEELKREQNRAKKSSRTKYTILLAVALIILIPLICRGVIFAIVGVRAIGDVTSILSTDLDAYADGFEDIEPYMPQFIEEANDFFEQTDASAILSTARVSEEERVAAKCVYEIVGYYMVFKDEYKVNDNNNVLGIVYKQNIVTDRGTYGPIYDTYEFKNIYTEDGEIKYEVIGSCTDRGFSDQGPELSKIQLDFKVGVHGHVCLVDNYKNIQNSVLAKHVFDRRDNCSGDIHYWLSDDLQLVYNEVIATYGD